MQDALCARFNEAEAHRLGKPGVASIAGIFPYAASMRPRLIASENYRAGRCSKRYVVRFNEAEAHRLGKPRVSQSASESGDAASMRPRLIASENHIRRISQRG